MNFLISKIQHQLRAHADSKKMLPPCCENMLLGRFTFFTHLWMQKTKTKNLSKEYAISHMQDFVIKIGSYVRTYNPSFLIIPENGPELIFQDMDPKILSKVSP